MAEEEALLVAYPFRRDLMDENFRDFDYGPGAADWTLPEEWCRDQLMFLHRLMCLAHEGRETYIVGYLERQREHVATQRR